MVTFSHRDPGTPEEVWTQAFESARLPAVDLDGIDRLVVVAAHPDDETLGAAGLMSTAARRGIAVSVLIATDGEGSHPESPTHTPADLAGRRRREASAALARAAPGIQPRFLGVPDGETDAHRAEIVRALRDVLTGEEQVLAVTPWTGDGHRDHRVVGEVVADVCRDLNVPWLAYPIWLWHWGDEADVPWEDMELLRLDEEATTSKRAATRLHRSQIAPLSPAPGDEVMLHERMQRHFERNFEVFVRPPSAARSLTSDFFDGFYDRNGDDPWGFDSRWYEQRKRSITAASLPRERYRAGLELGCATGALTELLAERCDEVLALDIARAPLEVAAQRLHGRTHVRLSRATLPRDWPDGVFDLIVLSEVGYYFDRDDLVTIIRRILESLTADGQVIACHWRHPVAEYPLTGDDVHEALRDQATLRRTVRHEEEDFVLEVYGRAGARSVAAETGLIE